MNCELSAEEHLWRLLAMACLPPGGRMEEPVPWAEVVRIAQAGNVMALLHALPAEARQMMPENLRMTVAQAYYEAAALNILRTAQLARVGEALASVDSPVLLLKGAALAHTLYHNTALRRISDLDLAVRPQCVPLCREALHRIGYRSAEPGAGQSPHAGYRSQETFLPPKAGDVPLEIHWHLLDAPYYMRRVPMEWFWVHSESLTIAGRAFQVLTPEANLVYLPAHLGLHHRFQGLQWLVDLAVLIGQGQDRLDWDLVLSTARSFELVSVLQAAIERLVACWPSLPVREALARLEAMEPTQREKRLFRLLTEEERRPSLDFYADIVELPGAGERVRFLLANLFPRPVYMVQRYGVGARWQLPWWYLYRLGDGVAKAVRTLPKAWQIERGRAGRDKSG